MGCADLLTWLMARKMTHAEAGASAHQRYSPQRRSYGIAMLRDEILR
jgi:hypothetical protein